MSVMLDQLKELMDSREDEHLEFKEGKNGYDFHELARYCSAFANEGGGKLILGVTNKIPRRVVGSNAFKPVEKAVQGLLQALHMKVLAVELPHPDGRVLIFDVPSRPPGLPISYKGTNWMRSGESLVPMSNDMLRKIFEETVTDFSAEICKAVTVDNLNPSAIAALREAWYRKTGQKTAREVPDLQFLEDAGLLIDHEVTYAALVLVGSRRALTRHLSQAEIVFEYRSSDASGAPQERLDFRDAFFQIYDELWKVINLRNDVQHLHDGLFLRDIRTFNERAVREALLNAVSHRDYRLAGSIFVKQYPRRIEIVSPGGMPPGITPENILWRQHPRNRLIAEVLARCGFVERSGQGVNLMYEESVKEGKVAPDFTGTDDFQVFLTLSGLIKDPRFVKFLDRIGQEKLSRFATGDFLILDALNRDKKVPAELKDRITYLIEQEVVERLGKGRGTKYILSRKYYEFVGKSGAYTRKKGLDRETNKTLLLQHIKEFKKHGTQFAEFRQVLPSISKDQIKSLLRDLVAEDKIRCEGKTRSARWYPR